MRLMGIVAALCIGMMSVPVRAQTPAEPSFVVAVAPHTSARVIIEQYQPVRAALAAALGQPVEIITAPDFTEFARRAVAGQYDIAVTTGHQAELLRADSGYVPLLTYAASFRAVMVVGRDSPIRSAADLAGKVVLGLNPSSLVTLWGLHWLDGKGVKPRQTRYVSAADSVAQLILAGDAAAGFISLANFQKLPDDVQAGLRIQEQSAPLAGRVYMLNGRHAARRDLVLSALRSFAATAEGQRYFAENKLEGYRDITEAELQAMAPYADEVRRNLGGDTP